MVFTPGAPGLLPPRTLSSLSRGTTQRPEALRTRPGGQSPPAASGAGLTASGTVFGGSTGRTLGGGAVPAGCTDGQIGRAHV